MKSALIWPIATAAFFASNSAILAETQIPSTLECTALTSHPAERGPFTAALPLTLSGNILRGERTPGNRRPGKESFIGAISSNKLVRISGHGSYFDGNRPRWHYQFAGSVKDGGSTSIKGYLEAELGGHRDCSITFMLPSDSLAAILSPPTSDGQAKKSGPAPSASTGAPGTPDSTSKDDEQTRKRLSDLAQDLAEKQKQLLAAQEDLKKRQEEAAKDFAAKQKELQETSAKVRGEKKQLEAEQAKFAIATKDLNDRQNKLEAGHKDLKQEQVNLQQEQGKTKESMAIVQRLLDGIILPTTEDPESWLVRVAAVPIQQQQFCRIVDQFYDGLDKVYQTHNDIKKNTLFRDRQLSMAALLPHGEFSNWVVQIKEVTQAPDGSAAIMLQPPCRAMLGSDACQKNGSKVLATISPDSPLYRELSKVSAGDFVVVSGKILYAAAPSEQPLPTYATYQAGSHCSATEGSKQEDVFVTNITYLVQLR